MIVMPFSNAEITSLEGNTKLDLLSSDFSSSSLSILTIIANIILIPRQIVSGFTIKHDHHCVSDFLSPTSRSGAIPVTRGIEIGDVCPQATIVLPFNFQNFIKLSLGGGGESHIKVPRTRSPKITANPI